MAGSINIKINKKVALIICISLVTIVLIVYAFKGPYKTLSSRDFYDGISIENILLKGISPSEAKNRIEAYVRTINPDGNLSMSYQDKLWEISTKDIDFKYLTGKALEKGYQYGRSGNAFSRIKEIKSLEKEPQNIAIDTAYNKEQIKKVLVQIAKQINKEPQKALCFYKNGSFSYQKEVNGLELNIDESMNLLDKAIKKREFKEIPLVVDDVSPAARVDNLKDITSVLSSSVTYFNAGELNRSYNIKYACSKINGYVLMPGETFSMNEVLGPRTLENGYKDAKVILMDDLVDSPGGGVCQVTTTLYIAVLKSDLQVVRRTPHTFQIGYVSPGLDATIAENYLDFKFRNDKTYPVSLFAEVDGGALNIKVLGKRENDYTVKLNSVVLEEINPDPYEVIIDNTIPKGESIVAREPKKGIHVNVFRETYDKNGKLIEKEKISDDIYKSLRGQIKTNY